MRNFFELLIDPKSIDLSSDFFRWIALINTRNVFHLQAPISIWLIIHLINLKFFSENSTSDSQKQNFIQIRSLALNVVAIGNHLWLVDGDPTEQTPKMFIPN